MLSLPLALLAAAWPGYLQAGGLEKVWEVDLKKALQGEHLGPNQSFKVKSLSFSPDAQQIVVLLEGSAALFQVQNPKTVLGLFQSQGYDSFGWSPDGQVIHSGRHVVHLADRKACDLPQDALFPNFIGKGSLVALFLGKDYPLGPEPLRFYDAECQEQDNWEIPGNWLIMDASPDHGLLAVRESPTSRATSIVDPFNKRILHRWPDGLWFADSGNAICADKVCRDVDTGKQIGEAPVPGFTHRNETAARASRIVLDDYHDVGIPFSSVFTEMAARRRVWDFRRNKEVVSWQLKFLTYSITIDLDGFNRDRKPIPCAISPDGEYIVEGGDGKIWLYKIQP
jgi:hypothetical protein